MTAGSPTPEEAAAALAAIEQFLRDTATAPPAPADERPAGWLRAALLEGVDLEPDLAPWL